MDVCDCCGQRAYVGMAHLMLGLTMTYCAHHFAAVEAMMRREGWHVQWDRRDELVQA